MFESLKIKMFKFIRYFTNLPYIIWGILAVALIVRLLGITYGLPLYLNMDEPVSVSSSLLLRHSLNPEHFDWPHLFFYTNAIIFGLYIVFRTVLENFVYLSPAWYESQSYFVAGRIFIAVVGALTIFPIYQTTKLLFGNKTAILAAFILAILPVHVYESHFTKPDIYQTFIIAIALYFIVKVYLQSKIRINDYIYAGIFIGFATSIKYGAALIFLPFLIAVLINNKMTKVDFVKKFKFLFIAGVVSIVCFYVGTPYAIPEYQKFFSTEERVGALWQFENVGSIPNEQYPIEVYDKFINMYQSSLGVGVWIFFILATALFVFFNRRNREYLLLLLPTILFSLYISKFKRSPQHYFLFLIPLYIPIISAFILEILSKIQRIYADLMSKNLNLKNSLEIIKQDPSVDKLFFIKYKVINVVLFIILLVLILAPSVYATYDITWLLSKTDTRTSSYLWINSNLDPNNDRLYVIGSPFDGVQFDFKHVEKLTRLDVTQVEPIFPLYILIGSEDVKRNQILEGDRDPEDLKGNSKSLLRDAELVYSEEDTDRLGPPIFIFKVTHFSEE